MVSINEVSKLTYGDPWAGFINEYLVIINFKFAQNSGLCQNKKVINF